MIIFAAGGGCYVGNDIAVLDTIRWTWLPTNISGTIPDPRYGHSAVITKDDNMIVFGGWVNGMLSNELWQFNCRNYTWSRISSFNPPSVRGYHTAVITAANQMIVYGGY